MNLPISRRSFLKSLSVLPFLPLLHSQLNFGEEPQPLSQSQERPNILILVFDTLSARHMSLYGYNRQTTPHLARFAERATVYHAHRASGNYTTPGTASLLTGTYPWTHRAFQLNGRVAEKHQQDNLFRAFSGGAYTRIAYTHNLLANVFLDQFHEDLDIYLKPREFYLADTRFFDPLVANDFYTAYLSAEVRDFLLLSVINEVWRTTYRRTMLKEQYPSGIPEASHQAFFLLETVIDGIKAILSKSRQPFLAYFHLLPPHEPYRPRHEFQDRFEDGWMATVKKPHFFSKGQPDERLNKARRQYDAYLAYADAEFGRLYDFMIETGLLDNTYVVFTSDHGQMFERGIHGHRTPVLYEPLTHVPLLISQPRQQHRQDIYTPTSCTDLLPTLLHLTGQPIPDWCEGQLLPPFGEPGSDRSIFSIEAEHNPKNSLLSKGTIALVKDQYKLIHYLGYDGYEDKHELYDLGNDPEEMEDLYLTKKSLAADLQHELTEKLLQVNQPYLA